jgi:hypothetical protein
MLVITRPFLLETTFWKVVEVAANKFLSYKTIFFNISDNHKYLPLLQVKLIASPLRSKKKETGRSVTDKSTEEKGDYENLLLPASMGKDSLCPHSHGGE